MQSNHNVLLRVSVFVAAPFTTGQNTPLRLHSLHTPSTPFVYTTHRIALKVKRPQQPLLHVGSTKRAFFVAEEEKVHNLFPQSLFLLSFLHFLIERLAFFFPLFSPHSPFTTFIILHINKMSSDSDTDTDDYFEEIDLVRIPDVPLFDLVSQRLLLVSVPESEENPDEFMRNAAIDELKAEPSSLHIMNIEGTFYCYDESKIADGLFSTQNSARRVHFDNHNDA